MCVCYPGHDVKLHPPSFPSKGSVDKGMRRKAEGILPASKISDPPSIPLCPRWREVEGGYRNDSCQPPFTGKTAVKCDDDDDICVCVFD